MELAVADLAFRLDGTALRLGEDRVEPSGKPALNFGLFRRFAIFCGIGAVLLLAWLLYALGQLDARTVLRAIQAEPTVAPVVFVLILVVSANLLLPLGLGLNLGAGIIWGGLWGGALTTFASVLAALVGFMLARRFERRYLGEVVASEHAQSFLTLVNRHDWKLIFLVRLNPIVPFGLQNYLFGLTNIPVGRYVFFTSLACAVPGFLYASIGESIKDLVLTGELKNALIVIGIALLLITAGFLTQLYLRRAI